MKSLTGREEQRLRRAFAMIGEEAARDEPIPATAASTASRLRWRRRPAIIAGGLAAAAACAIVVAVIGGAGNGASQSPTALRPPDSSEGGSGITYAQEIACSRTIVVGDVIAVRDASKPGRVVVAIDVQEWIKPASGPDRASLNVIDPRRVNEKRWTRGTHVLFTEPLRRDELASVSKGREVKFDRKMLVEALPKASHATCPSPFRPD